MNSLTIYTSQKMMETNDELSALGVNISEQEWQSLFKTQNMTLKSMCWTETDETRLFTIVERILKEGQVSSGERRRVLKEGVRVYYRLRKRFVRRYTDDEILEAVCLMVHLYGFFMEDWYGKSKRYLEERR